MESTKNQTLKAIALHYKTCFIWAGIIILFAIKILHFFFSRQNLYYSRLIGDELYYHQWTLNISKGQLLGERAFFTSPLYAYFLGAVYNFFPPGLFTIRIINLFLSVGSALSLYLSGKKIFLNRFALCIPFLYGFCALFTFYESFGEKTMLVFFLYSLNIFLYLNASEKNNIKSWAACGFASGILMLAHGAAITLAVCISGYLGYTVFVLKKGKKRLLPVFLISLVAGFSPATIHNGLVADDLVWTASNGGQNFYTGNFKENKYGLYESTPFSSASIYSEQKDFWREADRCFGRKIKPSESSSFWFKQGLSEMYFDISHTIKRIGIRFHLMFNNAELTDTRSYTFLKELSPFLRPPFYDFGMFVVLGGLGFFCTLGNKKFILFHIFTIIFPLFFSLFFLFGRYRLPLAIPLIFFSTAFIEWAYNLFKEKGEWKKERLKYCVSMAVTALMLVGVTYGEAIPGLTDNPSVPHSQAAHFYSKFRNTKPELEIIEYKACSDRFFNLIEKKREIYIYPANKGNTDFYDCLTNVGILALRSGRKNELEEAIEYLKKYLTYDSSNLFVKSLLKSMHFKLRSIKNVTHPSKRF